MKRVLAIETSCDDTSVAIVRDEGYVEALVAASQDAAHAPFGGIVPEIASRNHTQHLLNLIEKTLVNSGKTWDEIDGIAVTNRPGLVGSLLVGLVTAKTLALAKKKPFIGVNHLEGHILAPLLRDEKYAPPSGFDYPFLALAVSGGHTSLYEVQEFGAYRILGQTIDDAAGEAFDKFAKLVGLGFPGGVQVDKHAKEGDSSRYEFPRALLKDQTYNFSYSGLKASAQRMVDKMTSVEVKENIHDLCASYQQAIIDVLMSKLRRAAEEMSYKRVVITGGVSANSGLRTQSMEWGKANGVEVVVPPIRFCTDNAAMIGYAGLLRLQRGETSEQTLSPSPRFLAEDFVEGP